MCLTCAFRFVYITRKIWNVSHSDSVVDAGTSSEVERLFVVRARTLTLMPYWFWILVLFDRIIWIRLRSHFGILREIGSQWFLWIFLGNHNFDSIKNYERRQKGFSVDSDHWVWVEQKNGIVNNFRRRGRREKRERRKTNKVNCGRRRLCSAAHLRSFSTFGFCGFFVCE